MKTSLLWASALTLAPTVLAQGLRQATGGPEPTGTPVPWYPSPEPEVSDCKADLITTLCDYKEPLSGTAVAATGKASCWEYCNKHQPCSFVIFVAGNPYTGTGTCWLYPGETFDASLGKPGCDYLSVFDKPDCGPTPTDGACAAADTPKPIATVCDYPPPDEKCYYDCAASSGSSMCLSQCAERDNCNYAVFVPGNENKSPYHSGTCWMYPEGKFDASKAGTCSGEPEQWVYENPCPKPPKPSTTSSRASSPTSTGGSSSSGGGSGSGSGFGSGSSDDSSSGDDDSSSGGDGSSSSGGNGSDQESDDSSSAAASATGGVSGEAQGATAGGGSKNDQNGAAPTGASLGGLLAVGIAALMWQGFR